MTATPTEGVTQADEALLSELLKAGEFWPGHEYAKRMREVLARHRAAEVERLREALREAESVFALVEHPSFADPAHQDRIEALGDQIGYGALMAGASAAWRKSNIVEGSEFVAGPCQATVTRTLGIIRAALAGES